MAQDEVQQVAELAHDAYLHGRPWYMNEGMWHLPFITQEERDTWPIGMLITRSVALCARTSYASDHKQVILMAQDMSMHQSLQFYRTRLHGMVPPHDGPKEHQARAMRDPTYQSGTLIGWSQLRHDTEGLRLLDAECQPVLQERAESTA